MQLKFSKANAKIEALGKVPALKKYLKNNKKVYSIDSGLSGWTCPGAKDCLSKVIIENGKRKIKDGPNIEFRCFSATQEAMFPAVYNQRKGNFEVLKKLKTVQELKERICADLPKNVGILRLNIAGDIFSQNYFDAICEVAIANPMILFYGYTKSLPFWASYLDRFGKLPDNFVLTASYGGRYDHLIDKYKFRIAKVVFSKAEARKLKLPIDHDDSHAADPKKREKSFALLLHATQPKGTKASVALQKLNGEGSYSRKK